MTRYGRAERIQSGGMRWGHRSAICWFPRGCALGVTRRMRYCVRKSGPCLRKCRNGMQTVGGGARIWSASIYQGAVRRAILDWKDHDDTELDGPFGRIMVSLLNKTPIPSSCLGHRVLGGSGANHRGRQCAEEDVPIRHRWPNRWQGIAWVRRRCATMQCPEPPPARPCSRSLRHSVPIVSPVMSG